MICLLIIQRAQSSCYSQWCKSYQNKCGQRRWYYGFNPDDIQSITVLKGGTAAALDITKRNRNRYNTSFTWKNVAIVPDWQYEYGAGDKGKKPITQSEAVSTGRWSWGAKMDGSDVIQFDGSRKYLYQLCCPNRVYRKSYGRLSLSNMDNNSIVPNADFNRKTINVANLRYPMQKLILTGELIMISQYGRYKKPGSVYDANGMEMAWNPVPIATNPHRTCGAGLYQLQFYGLYPQKQTLITLIGYLTELENGIVDTVNSEAILNYTKKNIYKDISLNALLGVNTRTTLRDETRIEGSGFILDNVYSLTNLSTVSYTYPYGRQDWFSRRCLQKIILFFNPSSERSLIVLIIFENAEVDFVCEVPELMAGATTSLLNIGEMRNRGIELLINAKVYKSKNFSWDVTLNTSYNKNTVQALTDQLNSISMATSVNGYAIITSDVGRPYSIIKGYKPLMDANGNIVITFLIDAKFGGSLFSGTDLYGTRMGLTKLTLGGRENGLPIKGVDTNGKPVDMVIAPENLRTYYDGMRNISSMFVYDASFIKLRQLVIGYKLPAIKKLPAIREVSVISCSQKPVLPLQKDTEC
ncbi:hypothetical protein FQR65_LT17927 [Abscondita terminalis]|nr:hypothetical protein FQR65_LT17927 [Abscondita terminalis]